MTPDRWRQISAIFNAAIVRTGAARAPYLAEACGADAALRRDVEAFLGQGESFLATPMALPAESHLGPYELLSLIGAGGMGVVYRARDTRLKRDVALKVLPEAFALDPDRMARFQREAELLATLNHPHIAAIYGIEEGGDTHALVMELVEGEDLSQRIARGPVPLDEALPIAKQIAKALEAAHEQGIVHRDLKPANIKVRPDGTVKVLDFGLAKLHEPNGPNVSNDPNALSMSPTITSPAMMTGVGVILGTAAYMAPEQAKGKPADKRSDIWAFGCVFFEMLTGKGPLTGVDVNDTLANVLKLEPDFSMLSADVPQPISGLLRRCLEKDPRKRVADISTALFVLDQLASSGGSAAGPPHTPLRRRVGTSVVVALVTSTVVGAGLWVATRPADRVPPRVSRLVIASSDTAALTLNGFDPDLAITPDGSRLVYVGNRGTQLFVRALDALEPVALFTGAPRGPFVSPDGQWIGFVDDTKLKKVAMSGGPAVTLATLDGVPFGATWAADDTVIVATGNGTTGLVRVAATSGSTTVLTRPDRAQGEADHWWPELLPGGRAVLFTIRAVAGGLDAAQVAVLDLKTGTRRILVRGGSHAHYVSSGHLVYGAEGTLRAVSFDLDTLETRGTPVPIVSQVVTTNAGAVDAVVAGDGTLAYVSGHSVTGAAPRALVWVDHQGRETAIPAPARPYLYPRLSPDGTRVAVFAADQAYDLWLWDLGRSTLTRATFDPGADVFPVWTTDGRRLVFSSERAGTMNLYSQAADGTGAVERLTDSPNTQIATSASPDGRELIFTEVGPKTAEDVMQVALDGTHRVTPLVQSLFAERNGIISPDRRWLAYEANDSGRFEIYVRPFPAVGSGHWQVSTGGGTRPLWTPGGQELVYVAPTGALMRVGLEPSASWAATTPTTLVKEGYLTDLGGVLSGRTHDISPDGQRFLMVKSSGGSDQTAVQPQIVVVQHFDEELKRLVPAK